MPPEVDSAVVVGSIVLVGRVVDAVVATRHHGEGFVADIIHPEEVSTIAVDTTALEGAVEARSPSTNL